MQVGPESIQVWEAFARERGLLFSPPSRYPHDELAIDGPIDGVEVAVSTRRGKKEAIETRVRAMARHAMLGRVEVRTKRWTDWLYGVFRGRTTTGDVPLDAVFSTFASSDALRRTILDARTLATLQTLLDKPHVAFAYENGAIALRWSGVETSSRTLEAATKLAAYLAVTGSEVSPYR